MTPPLHAMPARSDAADQTASPPREGSLQQVGASSSAPVGGVPSAAATLTARAISEPETGRPVSAIDAALAAAAGRRFRSDASDDGPPPAGVKPRSTQPPDRSSCEPADRRRPEGHHNPTHAAAGGRSGNALAHGGARRPGVDLTDATIDRLAQERLAALPPQALMRMVHSGIQKATRTLTPVSPPHPLMRPPMHISLFPQSHHPTC